MYVNELQLHRREVKLVPFYAHAHASNKWANLKCGLLVPGRIAYTTHWPQAFQARFTTSFCLVNFLQKCRHSHSLFSQSESCTFPKYIHSKAVLGTFVLHLHKTQQWEVIHMSVDVLHWSHCLRLDCLLRVSVPGVVYLFLVRWRVISLLST